MLRREGSKRMEGKMRRKYKREKEKEVGEEKC
jgi:hypothetical protein